MTANSSFPYLNRHDFITYQPELAIPVLVFLGVASIAGTMGNILILVSVATKKNLQNVESIFIVNLACADMYVTLIADPMSIIAKVEGPEFFDRVPGLCRAVGSLCTISCVTSLTTIAAMSCNRYVYIVHNSYYRSIFTRWNCVIMCIGFYGVGSLLVLLNLAGIGDHAYDHKIIECIWDRMANLSYTVVFSVVMVWVPTIVVGASYLHMYLHVKAVRNRVHNSRDTNSKPSSKAPSFKLAKTLFIIYCVFSTCWVPFAMLIVFDWEDKVSHEVFILIVTIAHMHPSINWIVYFFTNKKFHDAFIDILHLQKCCADSKEEAANYSTTQAPEVAKGNKTVVSTVETTNHSTDMAPEVAKGNKKVVSKVSSSLMLRA